MLLVIASAWVSVQLGSIASGWQVVLEVGAGTGAVYILRWYWWRINAWSEISAMACSLAVSSGVEPVASLQRQLFAGVRQGRTGYHRRHNSSMADGHVPDQA